MSNFTAVAVVPRESSWPAPSINELADALFGPHKDWQKAELIIEREMEHGRAVDQFARFLIAFLARHLPAVVDLHRSALRRAEADRLLLPSRFTYLPTVISSALKTEYFAKFIRDSPASVGHGLMLDELHSIERSLRGPLRFLKAEASEVPLSDRAHKALEELYDAAYRLLFICTHQPADARRSLAFDTWKYPSLMAVLTAFAQSQKKRTSDEWDALLMALAANANLWTEGLCELPFLYSVVAGSSEDMIKLSTQLQDHFVWHSCEIDLVGTRASCQEPPEGEEMMACGRCGVVRYCCKDHQRLDWKRHKARCFPITWDVRPPAPPASGGLDELD